MLDRDTTSMNRHERRKGRRRNGAALRAERESFGAMAVQSRYLPERQVPQFSERPVVFLAFETDLGGKRIYTGGGLGEIRSDGEIMLSPIAREAMTTLQQHMPSGRELRIVECRDRETAKNRVIQAVLAAPAESGVFVVASTSDVLDEILLPELLGLGRFKRE
jgi:hypothetical protein